MVITKKINTSIGAVIVREFEFMKFKNPIRIAIREKVSPLIIITRYKVSINLNFDSSMFFGWCCCSKSARLYPIASL
jgi:hypothetical protein